MTPQHIPVLLDEVLEYLNPEPGKQFIDCTVGLGGHAEKILERTSPTGQLLAIDRDGINIKTAKQKLGRFSDRLNFVEGSYQNLTEYAYANGFSSVDGILLDIGFSSVHIEDASRGFSFRNEGPLDMRYDLQQSLTAAEVINHWPKEDLVLIFRKYGEEKRAEKIASAIVSERKEKTFQTTTQLADFIQDMSSRSGKIHPATRIFQALRIIVNDELGALEAVLPQTLDLLKPGGRLAVISFHSLEDRIVKRFMKSSDNTKIKIITKKVIQPSQEEIRRNPRARSAKLRVLEKQ